MSRFSCRTEDISVKVLILPGFQEGLSKRGAWFAFCINGNEYIKQFKKNKKYIVRYEVYEPISQNSLSDGEIFHLINNITFSFDQYKNLLKRMEMQYKDIRKRGKLNAFIYLIGILTVRWYWWIFLTRGEMSLNNYQNSVKLKKVIKSENIVSRYWKRGNNSDFQNSINEVTEFYMTLTGNSLGKYKELLLWASGKAGQTKDPVKGESYINIQEAYNQIIKKFTGHSLYTTLLPTNFIQRVIFFFNRSFSLPMPDNIYSIRNLSKTLKNKETSSTSKIPIIDTEENKVDGNIIELYLLASKNGDPVCVADKEPLQLAGTLTRAVNMDKWDNNLKILLHVGTNKEKRSLTTGKNSQFLQKRILNASLDTIRQSETLLCYYMKEILPVFYKRIRVMYPFRSRLHSLFPWLFITNGIPVASVLAAVWLFIDPYYEGKFMENYTRYYNRILDTLDLSYHNLSISVKTDSALGHINKIIEENSNNKAFRDAIGDINQFALPVSLMDRALFNNLTMETDQLKNAKSEANSFTTIPLQLLKEELDD